MSKKEADTKVMDMIHESMMTCGESINKEYGDKVSVEQFLKTFYMMICDKIYQSAPSIELADLTMKQIQTISKEFVLKYKQ